MQKSESSLVYILCILYIDIYTICHPVWFMMMMNSPNVSSLSIAFISPFPALPPSVVLRETRTYRFDVWWIELHHCPGPCNPSPLGRTNQTQRNLCDTVSLFHFVITVVVTFLNISGRNICTFWGRSPEVCHFRVEVWPQWLDGIQFDSFWWNYNDAIYTTIF